MAVCAQVDTLIYLLFQGSVGINTTKNTSHLLLIGTPNLNGIGSWGFTIALQCYILATNSEFY
ncbi:hypothetical protein MXB_5652 [Myxobolus squamalis]|nr:hypothetical protein MXB_5652 [Myxobolus squamalis]